ncbi:TIGR03089 family protein [Actinopolymorpha alba]|uniref:TIGR03089 family protein n=1 Tax=Actinopolymorpha alba TaxID=533267 RepID=UPI00035D508D|nr:TIGR03089 family protein [Actinopolymorpha alba]
MAHPETPAGLIAAALAAEPAKPFLTFYDDATGERVELSLTTLENWVAKTANLLQDGLATEPGERAALLLPAHWQAAVWMLAAWSAGLVVDLDAPAGAEVVVTGPERFEEALVAGGRDTVALALRPLGGPFTETLPPGVLDYGVEVPSYADAFTPYVPPDPTAPALVVGGHTLTCADLTNAARVRADELGLETGARVLTDTNPAGSDGYLDALLAPLARQASVVLVRNLDETALERRATNEKVTLTHLRG